MKKSLLIAILFCFTGAVAGQAKSDPKPTKPQTEEYDGLFPVLGYLGGKLVDELKTRFNLEDEKPKSEKVETLVDLKIGTFVVRTKDMREKE